jgi:hypothetical protein
MLRRQLGQPEEGTLSMVFDCIMHQTHIQKPMILIEGKKKERERRKAPTDLDQHRLALFFLSVQSNQC